jgi:serine/threonine-protein phosphatase 5
MKLGSLDELDRARRTVLDPPRQGANLIPGDVLWSDPSNKPGLSPNKDRGIGLLWGPNMTEEFLFKYQIKVSVQTKLVDDSILPVLIDACYCFFLACLCVFQDSV